MIYFDMDGVLVDFYKSADKIKASSNNQFWKQVSKIGIKFWTEMDEIPEIRKLVELYKEEGKDISVLSKLPMTDTGNAYIGKSLWLHKHYPNTFHTIILTTGNKSRFCKPGDILIDDKETNINDWVKHGGIGSLY